MGFGKIIRKTPIILSYSRTVPGIEQILPDNLLDAGAAEVIRETVGVRPVSDAADVGLDVDLVVEEADLAGDNILQLSLMKLGRVSP